MDMEKKREIRKGEKQVNSFLFLKSERKNLIQKGLQFFNSLFSMKIQISLSEIIKTC